MHVRWVLSYVMIIIVGPPSDHLYSFIGDSNLSEVLIPILTISLSAIIAAVIATIVTKYAGHSLVNLIVKYTLGRISVFCYYAGFTICYTHLHL